MQDQATIVAPGAGTLASPDDLVALVRAYNPRSNEALTWSSARTSVSPSP